MKRLLIALITALAFASSAQAFTAAEPAAIVDGDGVGTTFGKVNVVFDTLWNETQEPVGDCGSGLLMQGVTQSGTRTCVPGGASTWLGLTDTPSAFTSNYWVKVNAAGTALEQVAAPTGSGDVTGPASATDNAIVRFDSTTGKLIQSSSATIDDDGNATFNTITSNGTDGEHAIAISNNTSDTGIPNNSLTIVSNVLQFKDSTGTRDDIALASDLTSSNTNLLQFINSDLGTADSGGTKVVRLPTAVNWDDAELYCDGTITGLNIVVEHATTPDGTYTAYATVTATGSIDTSGWANATAGTWVRARVDVVSTGDAATCWMPINALNN